MNGPPLKNKSIISGMATKIINKTFVTELLASKKPFQLIDVRQPSEFAAGTIGNAINIPGLLKVFVGHVLTQS